MQNFDKVTEQKCITNYRIFSDCEGTLYGDAYEGRINIALIEFLIEAQKNGYEVQIFSNDPQGSQLFLDSAAFKFSRQGREDLVDFVNSSSIDPKSVHKGEHAVIIFDDDHSTHQSLSDNKLAPDDERIPNMTEKLKNAQEKKAPLFSGCKPQGFK